MEMRAGHLPVFNRDVAMTAVSSESKRKAFGYSRLGRISALILAVLLGSILVAPMIKAGDVSYEFDELGRLRKVTHANGASTSYTIDSAGNRSGVSTVAAGASAGTIQFAAATQAIGEAAGTLSVTVSRTGGSTGAVTVVYSTVNGSAVSGADFAAVANQSVSWANGDTANKTVTVAITNDASQETSEIFYVSLLAPTGGASVGTLPTTTITITDNDGPPGVIQFTGPTFSVGEAGPTAIITASRTGGSAGVVGVSYATAAGGTATAGSDFTATSGTLSWADGVTGNKTFTVAITNDSAVESSETVNLALSAPTGGATLGSPSTAVLSITDNDVPPVGAIQFSSATYSVGEAGPTATITVSRVSGTSGAVGVSYATTTGGTATASSDYTARSGTFTWNSGDGANKTFTVPISEDSLVEGAETVNLALSSPTGGATLGSPSTAVLTINDNDNPPAGQLRFTAGTASVAETGTSITINVERVNGSFGAVGVTYATANGTANAGSDYTAATNQLSWANNETVSKFFVVNVADDASFEGAETFTAALSLPTGGATIAAPSSIAVTINDNETAPSFSIGNVSVVETATSATLTITKTGTTALTHSVNYATSNGTGLAGADYTAIASTPLSFAPGETSKVVTVTLSPDNIYEGSEFFNVNLTSPSGGATIGTGTGVVTINDDETVPSFSIANASVAESAGTATITVTKNGASALTHAISYATANGTAIAGSDYTLVSSTLSFAPNETSKTFTVTIANDTAYEGSETFTANLSAPTNGATISTGTATVTINDNDIAPNFTVTGASFSENAGVVSITVTKTGSTALTHNVNFATADGTALAGSDFTATSGTLSFLAADTSKTISLTLLNDSLFEGPESLSMTLNGATNGASIATPAVTVNISDDESAPSFSVANVAVNENAGSAIVTVIKSGATSLTHALNYASANGSAIAAADYTAVASSLSFAPAETSKTFAVAIAADSIFEGQEAFSVNYGNATNGATIGTTSSSVVINDSTAAPSFSISSPTLAENGGPMSFVVTKTGGTVFSHNVSYTSANGTATAGADYTAVSGTLSFGTSSTSQTISVPITADGILEGSETFTVTLSGATSSATISVPVGTGTITQAGFAQVIFSITGVEVGEAVGTASYTVTKAGPTELTHNVTFTRTGGTATPGSDFTAFGGALTFAPNETSKTIAVPIANDSSAESTETIITQISGPTGGAEIACCGSDTATITIIDNDSANTITISDQTTFHQDVSNFGVIAFYTLEPDGDIWWDGSDVGDWIVPRNNFSQFEVMAQPVGGSCDFQGFINQWLSLDSNLTSWAMAYSVPDSNTDCYLSIVIRAKSNPGVTLDSAMIHANMLMGP